MRELGLEPCQPKPKRFGLTQGTTGPVPDLVGRKFTADTPGEKLVGDITYISTGEGWLYLATVLDCCTKEVIRLCDGRPLPDPADIPGNPQSGTQQEARQGGNIPLRSWKQLHVGRVRAGTGTVRPPQIRRPYRNLFRQTPWLNHFSES
jgi:hypothetical protein